MKLILAALLLISTNAFATIGNVGHSTALDYAGAIVPETVEKIFINVKAAAAITAGQVVSLDLTADDGATVVVGPTTGLAPLCFATTAIASGSLGKCQTYGLFDIALFDSTASSATAGKRVWMATGNAGYIAARSTELATEIPVGYFYDAPSVSGTAQIFIKL